MEPLANGFRYSEGLPMFQPRMRCLPEAAAGLKAKAQDGVAFLDAQLATRAFVAGDTFTLADILLFCFLAFRGQVGQPLNPDFRNIGRWYAGVSERASAKV